MVGSAFDSFDASALGGFVESALGVRGGGDPDSELLAGDVFVAYYRSSGAEATWNGNIILQSSQWSISTFDAATTYGITIGGVTVSVAGDTNEQTTTAALLAALEASADPGFAAIAWEATLAGSSSSIRGRHWRTFTATNYTSGGTGTLNAISTTLTAPRCVYYSVTDDSWYPAGFGFAAGSSNRIYDLAVYDSRLYAATSVGLYRFDPSSALTGARWSLIGSSADLRIGLAVADDLLYYGTTTSLRSYDGSTVSTGLTLPTTFGGTIRRINPSADGTALCAAGGSAAQQYFAHGLPGAWTESAWYANTELLEAIGTIGTDVLLVIDDQGEQFHDGVSTYFASPATDPALVMSAAVLWSPGSDTLEPFGPVSDASSPYEPDLRKNTTYRHGGFSPDQFTATLFGGELVSHGDFVDGALRTSRIYSSSDADLDDLSGATISGAIVLESYGTGRVLIGGTQTVSTARGFSEVTGGAHARTLDADGLDLSTWLVSAICNIRGHTLI